MLYNTGINATGNMSSSVMTVDEANSAKVASMLISNYSSPVTPVRELIVNALEAIQGQDDGHVSMSMNTISAHNATSIFSNDDDKEASYVITITDNGCGMSHDFMENKFSKLTYSTKDKDVNAQGGFGIGSKGIMSIATHAVFRTVKDGEATVCVLSLDTQGVGISIGEAQATDEANGTTVTAYISADSAQNIKENIAHKFLDYLDVDTPLTVTIGHKDIPVGSIFQGDKASYTNDKGYTVHFVRDNSATHHKDVTIRSVGMPYPSPCDIKIAEEVSQNLVDNAPFSGHSLYALENDIKGSIFHSSSQHSFRCVVDVPPRDVVIHSSRESVVENAILVQNIHDAIKHAVSEFSAHCVDILGVISSDFDSVYEALHDFNKDNSVNVMFSKNPLNSEISSMSALSELREELSDVDTVQIIPSESHFRSWDSPYIVGDDYHVRTVKNQYIGYRYPESLVALNDSTDSLKDFLFAHDDSVSDDDTFLFINENILNSPWSGMSIPALTGKDNKETLEWLLDTTVVGYGRTYDSLRKKAMNRGRALLRKKNKDNKTVKDDSYKLFFYSPTENKIVGTNTARGFGKFASQHMNSLHCATIYDSSTITDGRNCTKEVAEFLKKKNDAHFLAVCVAHVDGRSMLKTTASNSISRFVGSKYAVSTNNASIEGAIRTDSLNKLPHYSHLFSPFVDAYGLMLQDDVCADIDTPCGDSTILKSLGGFIGYDADKVIAACENVYQVHSTDDSKDNNNGYVSLSMHNVNRIIEKIIKGNNSNVSSDEKFFADGVTIQDALRNMNYITSAYDILVQSDKYNTMLNDYNQYVGIYGVKDAHNKGMEIISSVIDAIISVAKKLAALDVDDMITDVDMSRKDNQKVA